jgi:hypothetical protein
MTGSIERGEMIPSDKVEKMSRTRWTGENHNRARETRIQVIQK